jgi:hypothetical protein
MAIPIEKARYRARARKAEFGEAKNGSEQVGIDFEVTQGEHKGEHLAYYGSFNGDTATEITIKALRTSGWKGDDVGDLSSLSRPDAPEVDLVCEPDTWEGKTHLKVKWVNAAGGLALKKPLDQAKRAALSARLRGVVAAVDQELQQSGGAAKAAAGDVPF